ncbi:MAG TPA: hypothetical protein VGM53_31610 [Streptosporangiaceae bacterium]
MIGADMIHKQSSDLASDLAEAIRMARQTWARVTGENLASMAGVGEDVEWRVRGDALQGQIGAGYERAYVLEIVKNFADMLGAPVTEWTATQNLAGVETTASFAGMTVTAWGTLS